MLPAPRRLKQIKIAIVVGLVALISGMHYFYPREPSVQHIIFREAYFAPLILAAFWFGIRGGLVISCTVSLLFLPFVLETRAGQPVGFAANILAIVLYNVFGVVLGALRDRDQKRLSRLRRTESLAAVGQAVSSVAHDMKTPLMAIGGFANQVLRKLPEDDGDRKKLEIVLKQTARLESMVKEMLSFSKPFSLECGDVHPATLLQECVDVTGQLAQEAGVGLELNLAGNSRRARWDHDRMQEALINLVGNAIQASEAGGTVVLSLGSRGERAVISVADQGVGVPPDKREEILNPFVTTKKEGTGLGLPIVKKIVEAHGGSLEMDDNNPRGAIFSLILPFEPE